MADKKVQIDILADAKNFEKGVGAASQSASKLENALKKLGPAGQVFQSVIDKVGLSSVTSAAGVAGVLIASVGLIEKSIGMYTELAEKVRNYSVITGQSAEESSRQVEAFQRLNVSEEAAATGMFHLGREAAGSAPKLKAAGIEVAHNADGTVDLNGTLLNVVGAYQRTGDAAQRDAIVFAAFGKSGAAMIPILEANSEELKKLEAAASKVLTQEDLDRARKYKSEQSQLGQSWGDFWITIGQGVTGPLADLFQNTNAQIYAQGKLSEAVQQGKFSQIEASQATMGGSSAASEFLTKMRQEYVESKNAQSQIDLLAQSQKDAAAAAKDEADRENALYDSLHKLTDATDGFKDAQFRVLEEQQKLLDAGRAYRDAVKQHGKNSEEATQADLKWREAQQSLSESVKALADAAVAQAEAQATANGTTLTASEKADIYRGTLEKLMKTLSPNDPLRKHLQGYIDELNAIPAYKSTVIAQSFHGINSRAGGNIGQFAEGGTVPGPTGAPQLAVVHGGEEVIPAGGRGRENHIHIHVDQGAYIDGPSIDRLANLILQRARFAPGT